MAQKRMFSLRVVDTDKFMDMPSSTQALYFHLGMHGDDDGFVSSPRKIARAAGCSEDDMRLLVAKGFVIPFDSGIVVITDWKINNTIKPDRYTETIYQEEKSCLQQEVNGQYRLGKNMVPNVLQDGSNTEPEYSIDKVSKDADKFSTEENIPDKHSFTERSALSADFLKSTAGIDAREGKQIDEMDFNERKKHFARLLGDCPV